MSFAFATGAWTALGADTLGQVTGVAADDGGRIFAADGVRLVRADDPSGAGLVQLPLPSSALLLAVAVDSEGRLAVVDLANWWCCAGMPPGRRGPLFASRQWLVEHAGGDRSLMVLEAYWSPTSAADGSWPSMPAGMRRCSSGRTRSCFAGRRRRGSARNHRRRRGCRLGPALSSRRRPLDRGRLRPRPPGGRHLALRPHLRSRRGRAVMSDLLRILTFNTQLRSWGMEAGADEAIPPSTTAEERAELIAGQNPRECQRLRRRLPQRGVRRGRPADPHGPPAAGGTRMP